MPRAAKIPDVEIDRELASLPGWARSGESLVKTYVFGTFPAAIAFVNRVADAAETMDHHPDLDIRYNKITAVLSTHSAGGITANDVALAKEMDRLGG